MNELIEALEAWERYDEKRVLWEQMGLAYSYGQNFDRATELAELYRIAREKTKAILAKVRS